MLQQAGWSLYNPRQIRSVSVVCAEIHVENERKQFSIMYFEGAVFRLVNQEYERIMELWRERVCGQNTDDLRIGDWRAKVAAFSRVIWMRWCFADWSIYWLLFIIIDVVWMVSKPFLK